MSTEFVLVCLSVFAYSLIQSIFGVGLLLFGTPTLLLLGIPFEKVLWTLLPCSILINLMQVFGDWGKITLKKNMVLFCLPFVAGGLWTVLHFHQSIPIKKYVGVLMILTACIRVQRSLKDRLQHYCRKYTKPSLLVIGALHGLTNMGGGLLTLFVGSLFTEKEKIRSNTAFGYLMMALIQLAVLFLINQNRFGIETIGLMTIALGSYLVIGNKVFSISSEIHYQKVFTAFISVFGITLLLF